MKPDMPSPVTAKSSTKDMYDEIVVLREENEQQQTALNTLNRLLKEAERKLDGYQYQIEIIRAVMSRELR